MSCGRCEHITVKFQQRDLEVTSDWDTLTPGSTAEYAWDEPMAAHRLRVVLESATEAFRDAPVQEYNLDDIKAHPKVRLGRAHSKMVQRVANVGRVIKDMSGMGNRTQSVLHVDQPELDARFVYVGVHADGPTRVLCFSETKDQYTRGSSEESMSLLTSKLARLQERIKASRLHASCRHVYSHLYCQCSVHAFTFLQSACGLACIVMPGSCSTVKYLRFCLPVLCPHVTDQGRPSSRTARMPFRSASPPANISGHVAQHTRCLYFNASGEAPKLRPLLPA